MLRQDGCEGLLQHELDLAEAAHDVEGRGEVGDCVLGEDQVQGVEVLAVEREGVVGQRVADLVLGVGVLRSERVRVGGGGRRQVDGIGGRNFYLGLGSVRFLRGGTCGQEEE